MRIVLVCGGSGYKNRARVYETLDAEHVRVPIGRIIDGGATGADELARDWARARGVPRDGYPVHADDWKRWGKSAGPRRNERMIAHARPTDVLAFPGGRGTADCVSRALARGFVRVVRPYQDAALYVTPAARAVIG